MASQPQIAIIGAGIAGLTAALRLSQRGHGVRIFESQDRAGGVLCTTREGGYVREHAANGFLGSHPAGGLALCREVGVALEEALPAARKRWIYRHGGLRELPSSPKAMLGSDFMSSRGKLRMLAEPFVPAESGEVTVGEFFERRLGKEALEAVVAPFVTGIFAGDVAKLSLAAAFPRLAHLSRRGGLVRGQLASLFERGGSEKAPGSRRLWVRLAGMQALVEALVERVGEDLVTNCPVSGLTFDGERVHVQVAGGTESFDAAVVAAPAHAASQLLSPLSTELGDVLGSIEYVAVQAVHLAYDRGRVPHPMDGFGFLVAEGEALSLLGVVFESSIFSGRAPAGKVLVRCMFGGSRHVGRAERTEEELRATAQRELQGVLGITGEPIFSSVIRWPRAIPQYHLGHLERIGRAAMLASELRLVLAGSSYRGVAINDCVADGNRVADDVERLLGLSS